MPSQSWINFLKDSKFSEDLMLTGNEFQIFGASLLKLLVPYLTWFVLGVTRFILYNSVWLVSYFKQSAEKFLSYRWDSNQMRHINTSVTYLRWTDQRSFVASIARAFWQFHSSPYLKMLYFTSKDRLSSPQHTGEKTICYNDEQPKDDTYWHRM